MRLSHLGHAEEDNFVVINRSEASKFSLKHIIGEVSRDLGKYFVPKLRCSFCKQASPYDTRKIITTWAYFLGAGLGSIKL
jgi:hypothetical protein